MCTYREVDALQYDRIIDQPVYKYYVDKKLRLIRNWFHRTSVLLEVGCGTGVYTTSLAKQCRTIVGLDISSKMVERGNAKAKSLALNNIHFVVGDVAYIPFRDKVFDLAFSVNLFHHVADETLVNGGILEKVRCSKQSGYILVFELNPTSLGWSKNPIPQIIRSFVYLLLFPLHQHVMDHVEERTRLVNITEQLDRIPKIKVVLRKIGGFIPTYCPKLLFKPFVLIEKTMEVTPLLRRYGAHILLVGKVQ